MGKKIKRVSASSVRKELTEARKRWGWTPSDIISLLRGGGSSSKGSSYERELCKRLSLWWTGGKRDDVFWRSSGSGARAKVRGRAGRDTAGQHGDMAATDPIGKPLIDLFTVEMKRGYSEHTIQDLIDKPKAGGVQVFEDFLAQTIESYEQAGSRSWMLITRRDRREALVWMPWPTFQSLRNRGAFPEGIPERFMRFAASCRTKDTGITYTVNVCGMTLDAFLETPPGIVASLQGR